MRRRPSDGDLELEPLLLVSPGFADMSDDKHTSMDKNDVEKVESISPSANFLEISSSAERKLVRKLDMRIMPIACILYLFACEFPPITSQVISKTPRSDLDRSNLGNARLQGLPEDTLGGDPTGELFDWVNSAFFFSYVGPLLVSLCSSPTCAL